jgi:putative transposase
MSRSTTITTESTSLTQTEQSKKQQSTFEDDRFQVGDLVLLANDPEHTYEILGCGPSVGQFIVESSEHSRITIDREQIVKLTAEDIRELHGKLTEKKAEFEKQPLPESTVCAETYTVEQQEEAQRREKILLDLEANIIETKEDAMEQMRLKPTAFNDVRRTYAKDPRWQALVPKAPGRSVGTNERDPEVVNFYMKAFDEVFWNDGATTVAIYPVFEALCRAAGKEPFSRSTAARVFREIDPRLRDLRKYGSDYVNKKYGAFPSDFVLPGPLARVSIDGTTADIVIIDDEVGKVLGRPYLTAAIDEYSSAFMAINISFCPASRATTAVTMFQALTNKRSLLASIGMNDGAWPIYGKPSEILVDKGSEFDNKHFRATCDKFGIKYSYRERVQQGGGVEDAIKLLNTLFVQRLEGSTGSRPRHDKDFKPEEKAVYNLRRFTQLVYAEAIRLNNMVREVDRLTPVQRWENGLKSQGMQFPPAMSMREAEAFMINMLPGGRVQVGRAGIKHRGIIYDHGPTRGLIDRHKSVSVRSNPLNLHILYVLHNGLWHKVRALKASRVPRTLMEQQAMRRARMLPGSITQHGVDAVEKTRELIIIGKKEGKLCLRSKASVAQAEALGILPKNSDTLETKPIETNRFANVDPFKSHEKS